MRLIYGLQQALFDFPPELAGPPTQLQFDLSPDVIGSPDEEVSWVVLQLWDESPE